MNRKCYFTETPVRVDRIIEIELSLIKVSMKRLCTTMTIKAESERRLGSFRMMSCDSRFQKLLSLVESPILHSYGFNISLSF